MVFNPDCYERCVHAHGFFNVVYKETHALQLPLQVCQGQRPGLKACALGDLRKCCHAWCDVQGQNYKHQE